MMTNSVLFHNKLIDFFNKHMFETLLYKKDLVNQSPKLFKYSDNITVNPELPEEQTKGYLLFKDNKKYLLPQEDDSNQDNLSKLPIRVKKTMELVTKQNEVVQYLDDYTSFRVIPDHLLNYVELLKCDGIESKDTCTWTLLKIIRNVAYCRRINIVISGIGGCGKTSAFEPLGKLTDKGTVIKQPKSVAGLSYGLRNDGFIVVDEIGALSSESRFMMANYFFQQGEFNTDFTTGKGKSSVHDMDYKYDISDQSCVVICNLFEDYLMTDPEKGEVDVSKKDKFFHFMFDNSQAINLRFLPMRVTEPDCPLDRKQRRQLDKYIPVQQFTTNNIRLTDDIKKKYIDIIKSFEWYVHNWETEVDYEFVEVEAKKNSKITERHYPSYKEILAGIYLFAKNTDWEMFDYYRNLLDQWIDWYYQSLYVYSAKVLNNTTGNQAKIIEEKVN